MRELKPRDEYTVDYTDKEKVRERRGMREKRKRKIEREVWMEKRRERGWELWNRGRR